MLLVTQTSFVSMVSALKSAGLVAIALARVATGLTPPNWENRVMTTKGLVEGFESQGVRQFRGIPFAKPPVEELRWQDPQEPAAFQGTFLATTYGNACMQKLDEKFAPGVTISEDCL